MVVHNRFSKWLNLDLSTLRGDCGSPEAKKRCVMMMSLLDMKQGRKGSKESKNSRVDILLCWIIRRTTTDINAMYRLIYAHIIYAEMVRKC